MDKTTESNCAESIATFYALGKEGWALDMDEQMIGGRENITITAAKDGHIHVVTGTDKIELVRELQKLVSPVKD